MATEPQLDIITPSASCNERNKDDIDDLDSSKQLDNISDHDSGDERSLKINYKFLSDDEAGPVIAPKKRRQRFSDSDGDVDGNINHIEKLHDKEIARQLPESTRTPKENKRSRIKKADSSDSDDGPENTVDQENSMVNKIYKSNRIESKSNNLKNKFKNLMSHTKNNLKMSSEDEDIEKPSHSGSDHSDGEYSCLKIKQNVKSAAKSMNSICDPDTSDEENSKAKMYQRKSKPKITKSTSPKPIRMSAKQAMENMQKIKSESNRMLREKGVSLPYHRPKALTLKDIMNRRKPAVSSDGKTLPIKMNESQLREYAMLLEQRQKEVIELCKSDTEEEDKEDEPADEININDKQRIPDSNNSTELAPNVEPSSEIILNQNQTNEELNVDQSMENDDVKNQSEPSKSLELVITTESPNNDNTNDDISNIENHVKDVQENILLQKGAPDESQTMSLHYDSERIITNQKDSETNIDNKSIEADNKKNNDFSDSDSEIDMDEIDKIIQEAEIICDKPDTPKLTGAPGTVINLENEDSSIPRKLSGVELLKERFTFFAKLKTQEDIEKDREKKFKPGTQHLKLKHELEQQIAEQRSIEWEKRLEEEKQLKSEMNIEHDEDEIERLESKLQEIDKEQIESDSSDSEEELIENDVVMEDRPQKRNPMLDDEADVSDDEKGDVIDGDGDLGDDESDEELDSGESSCESEDDSKPKKGRILKAFEDSDDETENNVAVDVNKISTEITETVNSDAVFSESQDDELPLAQGNKSSDDLFSTQSTNPEIAVLNKNTEDNTSTEITTQIICLSNSEPTKMIRMDINPDNMNVCGSQSQNEDVSLEGIVGMCTGNFSENLVSSQMQHPSLTQTQEFGDDIAAMCTGQFYNNTLVSQENTSHLEPADKSQDLEDDTSLADRTVVQNDKIPVSISNVNDKDANKENKILNSILDELGDLDDKPKQYKYFTSGTQSRDKKKFTIESDDESNVTSPKKKVKKLKKRKAELRALHISDDEDEEEEEVESEIEEDENEDRIIEYDSEENEIEVTQPKIKPPKKGMRDFFENEAELSSEDEWIGSGDEDERGLDTMEREEGDDETFHQGQLQRELGQIHMREVLDQDKREVRLIQELLFEDGDLGDGHRQRKFRWKNADGDEETGMNPQEITDTQEDEFESEEQWRKERHEREMFIRKMRETDEEDKNTSINRSTIIKANLCSRSMSSLISEIKVAKTEIPVPEKKTAKDIPSPKKSFNMFKHHTSLLTRGGGALARLAALATPLADTDAPRNISTTRGNFVFTAVTSDEAPKVTKRKAEKMVHTPRLIKKMKTEDLNKQKPTLFDRIKN